ncbi:MAG: hypothetical protein N2109_04570 [Fimbriimonadales bacterium]|nr:hypothetical protein [Fimbriimonadales bacterium]
MLWAYLALFVVLAALGFREDARRGQHPAYLALGASTSIALAVGLFAAAAGYREPSFLQVWRWVSVYAAVTFLFELGHDVMTYRHEDDEETDPERLRRREAFALVVGTIVGAVVFVPAVWINLALAFGRY